jgi:DNA-binding GntR family transcriptional regulator
MIESVEAADIKDLRRLAAHFDELVLTGTILEQYEANIAFHVRLLKLCSNQELISIVMELRGRGPSAPATQWKTRARIEQSGREHFLMIDALEARDAAALRRILTAHIRQTGSEDTSEVQPPKRKSG